jgi:carboxyl-terminal processing protease
MKKLDASLIVMILCAVLIIAMSMGLGYLIRDKAILGDESYDTVREAAETIGKNFYYYDDEKQAGLIDDALRGMVSGLDDPYAAYLTAEEYDAMLAEDEGDYSGIGISVLTPDETGSAISQVYAGGPAEEAGLLAGDVIVSVNGVKVANLSMDDFVALFSTDDAIADQLVVSRGGKTFDVSVLRRAVHVNRVFSETLNGNVGYIRITEFNGSVGEEFWSAAQSFQKAGLDSLIIDLRNNPGGGLTEVLNVANHLVPEGEIISTIRSKSGTEEVYRSQGKEQLTGMEIVVLVNGNSASASEFLTGALKDHGIATIVGTQTFGKGIVQSYFRLRSNGGWIKMTTDAYFTPSGVCIQDKGITPDITVELSGEAADTPLDLLDHALDAQLQAALRVFDSYAQKAS